MTPSQPPAQRQTILSKAPAMPLIVMIRAYQLLISPWLGNNCRFYPSCSHYAESALRQHGLIKGFNLTIRRICRCHPWHPGGFDPVPPTH